jgi:hypothetical protein
MSTEKANVLRGLGAKIIRTPNEASFDSPDSHLGISKAIHDKGEAILLDQYCNPSNPIGKKLLNFLSNREWIFFLNENSLSIRSKIKLLFKQMSIISIMLKLYKR